MHFPLHPGYTCSRYFPHQAASFTPLELYPSPSLPPLPGARLSAAHAADEENVADTIVRARKSWKTVKGRSEPVWPPHLEKALVQGVY